MRGGPESAPASAESHPGSAALPFVRWATAARWAIATLVTMGVLGELLALLVYAAGSGERPSLVNFLRLGVLLMFAFHHVGIVLEGMAGPATGLNLGGGAAVLIVAAPLAGTLLAAVLLARGGRTIAERAGGGETVRILRGATVGVPYSLLAGALSWAVTIPANDLAPGNPPIHPAHLPSFLWPLAVGMVAGACGGLASTRSGSTQVAANGPRLTGSTPLLERVVRSSLAGGGWMFGVGLAASFAGLLVLAPLNPEATRLYFTPFSRSTGQGFALVAFTLMVLPNMALITLASAMGACLRLVGTVGSTAYSFCLLSYSSFPSAGHLQQLLTAGKAAGGASRFDLAAPSAPYFLFVAAPVLAVVAGGVVAARRSRPADRTEGAVAGALAGVVFAVLILLGALVGTGGLEIPGSVGSPQLSVRAGPDLVWTPLLALAWGVLGGTLGGILGFRPARP